MTIFMLCVILLLVQAAGSLLLSSLLPGLPTSAEEVPTNMILSSSAEAIVQEVFLRKAQRGKVVTPMVPSYRTLVTQPSSDRLDTHSCVITFERASRSTVTHELSVGWV
eukprot:5453300-Amphidinium_carterae.1